MVSVRFRLRICASFGTLILLVLLYTSWTFQLDSKRNNSWNIRNSDMKKIVTNLPRQQQATKDLMKNTVVLTSTNSGFLYMTINWLESIKKLEIHPNIVLIAEDGKAYEKLKSYNDSTTFIRRGGSINSTNTKPLVYDTPEYKQLVYKRPRYIYDELQKGKNVFFCDVDTFWLKDPFPYFVGDYDIILQRDMYFRRHDVGTYCAGMVYFRSNTLVKTFVDTWSRETLSQKSNSKMNDQNILNKLLKSKRYLHAFKRKVLKAEEFPNGQLYFNDTMPVDRRKAVAVHNNWVLGYDNKVERFKKAGLWLIDDL